MLDFGHVPTQSGATVETFYGTAQSTTQILSWNKPRGKSMIHILLVGSGGNGGSGAIGDPSLAGGGGGAGSGAQTSILAPISVIPDTLFLLLYGGGTGANASRVMFSTEVLNANTFVIAGGGGNGGDGTLAGAGGLGGSAGNAAGATTMILGWAWAEAAIAGQGGTNGGTNSNAGGVAVPTTGLLVTAGAGGGGLPDSVTSGSYGGSINGGGIFPTYQTLQSGNNTTTPGKDGHSWIRPLSDILFYYGGQGGGSTHGAATGAGLFQARGGNGGPGCGGGGSGAALTGSTPALAGRGGPSFCVITCW